MTDPVDEVAALLAAAGIEPSPAEVERLAARYDAHRQAMDAMFEVPMAAEEGSALTFSPPTR